MKKIDKWFLGVCALYLGTLIAGLIYAWNAEAGTCTTITRSNVAANSILTSTTYNNDLNSIYAPFNTTDPGSLDGGCVEPSTLESDSLNSADFAPVLNGIHEGCKVSKSDDATISVDRCMLSVNGNFVRTTSATTVTWGCTNPSCSAEAASTDYYVYAASDSSSTDLNLVILDTAPNGDGYDSSNNKVLGWFRNNNSSDIASGPLNWYVDDYATNLSKGTAYIKEEKPAGTQSGTFTSGAWRTRNLNKIEGDSSFVFLSGINQFTLQPGTYEIWAQASAYAVGIHQAKLRNITDNTDDIIGFQSASNTGTPGGSASHVVGRITISSEKTFEIQHRCQSTFATYGFGEDANFGTLEIFTQIKITRIGL